MKLKSDNQGPRLPPLAQVVDAIKESVTSDANNDSNWALHLKRSITTLGRQWGWEVRQYEKADSNAHPWLFDHTWAFTADHRLRNVALVMEVAAITGSYWNLIYDFEKLLAARSPLKIIVFAAAETERENCFLGLGQSLRAYIHTDPIERYILACWKLHEGTFDVRTWQNGCFSRAAI